MAKATRIPGRPGTPATTREEEVVLYQSDARSLRVGDVVVVEETDERYPVVKRTAEIPGGPAIPLKVTLELSEDEAQFLVDVLRSVGGNEGTSRRRHGREILTAFRLDAGITRSTPDAGDMRGSIYFE
jgi:hypothetical protein